MPRPICVAPARHVLAARRRAPPSRRASRGRFDAPRAPSAPRAGSGAARDAPDAIPRGASSPPSSSSPSLPRRALLGAGAASLSLSARVSAPPPARADELFCGYYTENSSVTPQWAFKTPWAEGVVDVASATGAPNAKTFLRVLGKRETAEAAGHLPVLCLHGGPGLGFKYMDACEILASSSREVASYDQIGCARSKLDAPALSSDSTFRFSPATFASELRRVREVAGLDDVHILAHGWGAMLALDHALDPMASGTVASLVLVSCPPSYAALCRDRRDALAALPLDVAERLLEADEKRLFADPRALRAPDSPYADAWSAWVETRESRRAAGGCYAGLSLGGAGDGAGALRDRGASDAALASAARVALDMTGGRFFTPDGALAGWEADEGGRLGELSAKVGGVRFARGTEDALSLRGAREVYDAVARAEMAPDEAGVGFESVEGAGSCVHLDASAAFLESVDQFLAAHDRGPKA